MNPAFLEVHQGDPHEKESELSVRPLMLILWCIRDLDFELSTGRGHRDPSST